MRDFDQEQRAEHAKRQEEFAEKKFTFRGATFDVNAIPTFHKTKVLALADWQGAMSLQLLEDSVLNLIDDRGDDRARFQAIVAGEEPNEDWFPVTTQDLLALHNWLVGEASERPPTQPEASSNGSQGTGAPSTASSSSEQAGASTN